MRFTVLPLLTLAASVGAFHSAWNVTSSSSVVSQQVVSYDLTAVFVSNEYPDGLESKCSWLVRGMQPLPVSCSPDSFSVQPQSDGSMKIQQTIQKPTNQTVYGQGNVPSDGHVVINVTSAVA